jgi:DNA-binding FadR family transcriptional regulator
VQKQEDTADGKRTKERGLPLEAIEQRRLYRLIADQVRQLIDRGEYAVGSRLPSERELADMLGVSRPTVREALIALEVEGRLRIRVGSGVYVASQRPIANPLGHTAIEGPFEVLRARAFVESAVAEEAARCATREDVVRLDAVLAKVGPVLTIEGWVDLDRRFHKAVAMVLGNVVLLRTVGELFDQRINPYFAQLSRHICTDATRRAAHAEHVAIRDAIAARDPARARAAMRDHLEQSHERFARDFGEASGVLPEEKPRPEPTRPLIRRRASHPIKARKELRKAAAC